MKKETTKVPPAANWKLYCHTFPNGKKYIGITKQDPARRWGKDGNGYKGQAVYAAIQKYGWDNVRHEVLLEGLTEAQAKHYEEEYIRAFNTYISRNGYNCTKGGDGAAAYNRDAMYKMWKRCGSIEYVANVFGCGKAAVRKVIQDREQKGKVRSPEKERNNKKNIQKRQQRKK